MAFLAQSAAPGVAVEARGPAAAPAPARARLNSIDLLRGVAIVLMALDHVRDFLGTSGQNPRDLTAPALFLTRWVTHLCAPTFVLLAGVSAYLYGTRGRSAADVSRFLLTRGLWLIFVEFTLVGFGWSFAMAPSLLIAQVIWVLGVSMIVMAALVHLPRWAIAAVGIALIAGHDLLDGIHAASLGSAAWVWNLLHEPATLPLSSSSKLIVIYPIIPWPGVMALGYALGPLFQRTPEFRRKSLVWAGAALIAGFVALRATNAYGDPAPWATQATALGTVLSFLNCEKYPASLLYLLMTLGPALLLLAVLERARGPVSGWVTTFGRVPFLFYTAHLPVIHLLAVALAWVMLGQVGWAAGTFLAPKPLGYGLPLVGVYGAWVLVLLVLYPACRWFAALKSRRHDWWLSYL